MRLPASGPFWLVTSLLTISQVSAPVSVADDAPKPNPAVEPGRWGAR